MKIITKLTLILVAVSAMNVFVQAEKESSTAAIGRSSGQAAEQLVSGITDLIKISRCGNLDFLITTDQDKNLVAVIEK